MSGFRDPDWQGPHTLGMWKICYSLDPERHLLLFRGGGRHAPTNPSHEWGLVVMCGNVRDLQAEQRLRSLPGLEGPLRSCRLGDDDVFALNEGDIDFVVNRIREAFHRAAAPAGD
jgi:hypothetical protein